MSRPRYDWWQTVRAYVRAYPGNCARIRELEQVSMTAACSGMPGGGGVARTTEQVALRALSTWERTGYDAVQGGPGVLAKDRHLCGRSPQAELQ